MKYSKLLKFLLASCLPLYGVEEDAAATAAARGDDFVPTEDKVDKVEDTKTTPTAEEKAEAEEIATAIAEAKAAKAKKEADEKAAAGKTDAEKAAEKEAEEKEKKNKDTRIPLARHEAVLKKERETREALEVELSKYKQGKEIAATNAEITAAEAKLETLEAQYVKHNADGQLEKAAATMKEIRLAERGISEKKSEINVAAAEARAVERVRFETTVDRLEEAYPQIRPGHEDYDKDVVAEMLEMQSAYVAKGYPPSQALQKAVGYILKPTTTKQQKAVDVEAKVSEEDKAKAAREARKAAAVAKALEADGKTPPDASKVGKDHDKAGGGQVDAKTVMKMNQADFAKLDEAALSRLRGDEI